MTTATKTAKKKVVKKKAARKSPTVKKGTKGKGTRTKKKTAKASTNGKPVIVKLNEIKVGSTRMRMFKALNKYSEGLTAGGVKDKTGMLKKSGHLARILGQELKSKRIHTEVYDVSGKDVRFYQITKLGIKDLKARKIDKSSASRIGQKWGKKRREAEKKKK